MSIAENVELIQKRITAAAARIGRSADDITLVAVSKQKPASAIRAAYDAGLRHFGENRSAELADKAAELSDLDGIAWEFIGQLQTRQSLPVAQLASVFHAADRVKIAQRLSRQLVALDRTLALFVEVNVSGEGSKAGFNCSNWEQDANQRDALLQSIATIAALPRIEIHGLMTMAPWGAPPEDNRQVFIRTRKLSDWLQSAEAPVGPHLSMGMTDDFELAIEEGATHVRVGRAIFGARQY